MDKLLTDYSTTSPLNMGLKIEIPVFDTIPIIFIPGIMGSNLRNIDTKKPVWSLGNGAGILGTVKTQGAKLPAQLQRELNPTTTEVDPSGDILTSLSQFKFTQDILRQRGWGTVHWDSYGDFLVYLQLKLMKIGLSQNADHLPWAKLKENSEVPHFNPQKNYSLITESEILHLKKFFFPVHALGYNWLQSNEESAKKIAKQMDEIKKQYGEAFRKFIVVSHSMGGLVARRLSQLKASDIAGVVHGVMPADGAAATYRRLVTGSYEGGGVLGLAISKVIGATAAHVTAVLGSSAGALELLPCASYQSSNGNKAWLELSGLNERGEEVKISLPKNNNPYDEIYKRDGVWWEMVKEELLDPANMINVGVGKKKKTQYFKTIEKVQNFHEKILDKYHTCTYAFYGRDTKYMSFGVLKWNMNGRIAGLNKNQLEFLPRATSQQIAQHQSKVITAEIDKRKQGSASSVDGVDLAIDHDGVRYIALSNGSLMPLTISKQDVTGDGTVPNLSGVAPLRDKNIKQVFQMKGFDHQGGFNNDHTRLCTLYSIVKIIKDNNIQPKFR